MAGKKVDRSAYKKLRQDLKSGQIGQMYVFHGEEKYLMEQCVTQIRRQLVPEGMEEFNLHTFQGKDIDVAELATTMDNFPMMSERTLILVTDFDLFGCSEKKKEILTQAISDLPEYLCLVFVYDLLEYKIGNGKFQNLVKKTAEIVDFAPLDQGDLVDWVRRRFKEMGKTIDDADSEYLLFLCGGLMTGLQGEIHKIASYASETKITRRDINAVAEPVLEAQVFDITNAIGSRNFVKALGALADLYAMKVKPQQIMGFLCKHLRQMYSARLVLEARKGTPRLMELWNMRTNWQADKLMNCARSCSLAWCRKAVQMAAETDLAMKSSGRDAEELLSELLLRLANL